MQQTTARSPLCSRNFKNIANAFHDSSDGIPSQYTPAPCAPSSFRILSSRSVAKAKPSSPLHENRPSFHFDTCSKVESTKWAPGLKVQRKIMFYIIAAILLILWALGTLTGYTMAGFIHVLLIVALVMVFVDLFTGHRRA